MGTRALVLVGMPGSGKGVVADTAVELGVPTRRMGDAIWDEVRARGLPLEPDVVGRIAQAGRDEEGPGIWAKRIAASVQGPSVLIDGTRSLHEIEVFESAFDAMRIVAVHASPSVRHARLLSRGRPDDPDDVEAVKVRDRRELGWGIGAVIALADVMLINEGTLDELRSGADRELCSFFDIPKEDG
jgi:dephospho-CoA kinase